MAATRSGPGEATVLTLPVGAVTVRVMPFSAKVPATESQSTEMASTACWIVSAVTVEEIVAYVRPESTGVVEEGSSCKDKDDNQTS